MGYIAFFGAGLFQCVLFFLVLKRKSHNNVNLLPSNIARRGGCPGAAHGGLGTEDLTWEATRARLPMKPAAALSAMQAGTDSATYPHRGPVGVDANIVTALDVSDSIGRYEEWLEQVGTARSVMHHSFLSAIAHRRHSQIGFAVYTWSSGAEYRVIVPWTMIDGVDAASEVSDVLLSAQLVDRSDHGGTDDQGADDQNGFDGGSDVRKPHAGMTDISGAILFGHAMLRSAPYGALRKVINIFTNGMDNVGEGPDQSRDWAVAAGETVNAVALGHNMELPSYLEDHVAGGPGSFVMNLTDAADARGIIEKKFLLDLVS